MGTRATTRLVSNAVNPKRLGAYGLQLGGLDAAGSLLGPADASWPRYAISSLVGDEVLEVQTVGRDRAELAPPSGTILRMERDPGRATFVAPAPLSAHALVHPLLSHVAAIAAWWHGRESLHAGAYVVSDGVWALVGGRGAGKSTTLSWLAREGSLVVCDDMLVLKGDRPFAGPRAIDLRRSAAERFGDGESLGVLGERERWRVPLEALASLPRLKGFVHLAWGDEVRVRPLRAQRRVELLMANRGVRLPAVELGALIELASLAWYELERPQQWDALPRVADELRRLAG